MEKQRFSIFNVGLSLKRGAQGGPPSPPPPLTLGPSEKWKLGALNSDPEIISPAADEEEFFFLSDLFASAACVLVGGCLPQRQSAESRRLGQVENLVELGAMLLAGASRHQPCPMLWHQ